MANIAPTTVVWVLQNCPLDNTYEHTIWFYNAGGQQSYFRTLRRYLLDEHTYQRVGRDRIRVELPYDSIYDCNYIMFLNQSYENKWFYAFITDIEYINNAVCEITYELDVMQTWMFDYQLMPSFVEREHAMTDVVGDNILPEPVGLGEYVFNGGVQEFYPPNELRNIVIVAVVDVSEGGDSGGGGDEPTPDPDPDPDPDPEPVDVVVDITGTVHSGLYHSTETGAAVEKAGAVSTEIIDISAYETFTVTRTASSIYNCFYDSTPKFIENSSFSTGIGDTVVGGSGSFIPIPANAKYVIISNDIPDNISVTVVRHMTGEDLLGDPITDVATDVLTDGPGVYGHVYDGIYGAATLWAFLAEDVESINAKLNEYIQKPEAVIGVYTCNSLSIDHHQIPTGGLRLTDEATGYEYNGRLGFSLNPSTATLDGYKPRNRKLYTYPYNFVHVDNLEGGSLDLRYEFFEGYSPTVKTIASITQPVEVLLRPTHYKNSGDEIDITQGIKIGNFPLCSWAFDAYQAWIAQNAIPQLINVGAGIANGAMAGIMFGPLAGAMSGVGTLANTLTDFYTASIQADITRGNIASGSAAFGHKMKDFFYARMSITDQHARMIDEFFDRYGYATNRVKQPNISGRTYWNYVKTKGAVITGSVPTSDANKICSIYDKGITFWKSGNQIGNYSLDNRLPG